MRRVGCPLEVRWFIAVEVPTELEPSGRFEQRTDWYHVDSLSADTSIKRRGNVGALELKWRIGGTILFERKTVIGYAEQWSKERLGDRGSTRLLTGDWIEVHKELWSTGPVQIAGNIGSLQSLVDDRRRPAGRIARHIGYRRARSVATDDRRPRPSGCQRYVKTDPLSTGRFESLSQHSSAMRRAMGRRGRKRQLVVEDEYWALVLAGVGTVEACRRVGIGRKTGYRWRAERGGLPPLRLPESERGDRYLSLLERKRIATLRERGHGVREIARRVKRAAVDGQPRAAPQPAGARRRRL